MMTNNYNKLNESQNKLRQFSPGTYSKFKLNENKSWNKTKSVKLYNSKRNRVRCKKIYSYFIRENSRARN